MFVLFKLPTDQALDVGPTLPLQSTNTHFGQHKYLRWLCFSFPFHFLVFLFKSINISVFALCKSFIAINRRNTFKHHTSGVGSPFNFSILRIKAGNIHIARRTENEFIVGSNSSSSSSTTLITPKFFSSIFNIIKSNDRCIVRHIDNTAND